MNALNIGDTGYIIDCGIVEEIRIVDVSEDDANIYYYMCNGEYYSLDVRIQPVYKTWMEAMQAVKLH